MGDGEGQLWQHFPCVSHDDCRAEDLVRFLSNVDRDETLAFPFENCALDVDELPTQVAIRMPRVDTSRSQRPTWAISGSCR